MRVHDCCWLLQQHEGATAAVHAGHPCCRCHCWCSQEPLKRGRLALLLLLLLLSVLLQQQCWLDPSLWVH